MKDKYDVVFKALTLACKQLEKANIEISTKEDYDIVYHKVHGELVGYFLLKAEKELKGSEVNNE